MPNQITIIVSGQDVALLKSQVGGLFDAMDLHKCMNFGIVLELQQSKLYI